LEPLYKNYNNLFAEIISFHHQNICIYMKMHTDVTQCFVAI